MFPAELLDLVCSYASKHDLKHLRLVNRALSSRATPYLFDRIVLAPRRHVFERFEKIAHHPHLSKAIRELVVDTGLVSAKHGLASTMGYYPCRKEQFDGRELPPALVDASIRYISEQWDIMTALASGSLLPILRLLPNITSINLNQNWMQPTSWDPLWPEIVNSSHAALRLDAQSECFFYLVWAAISSLPLFPKAISCRGSDKIHFLLLREQSTAFFLNFIKPNMPMNPEITQESHEYIKLPTAENAFSAARYIHMTIPIGDGYKVHDIFPNQLDLPHMIKSIPAVLRAASDLEELELNIFLNPLVRDRLGCALLEDHLLGKHTWPKLRKVTLVHCDIRGPDLIDFISRHQVTLRKLTLKNVGVRFDDRERYSYRGWAGTIADMRASLGSDALDNLDLRLHGVKSSIYELNYDLQSYALNKCQNTYGFDSDDLRPFFKDDAPNPFLLGNYSDVAKETDDENMDGDIAGNEEWSDLFSDLHI